MKRFYKAVEIAADGGILLDRRPVRTPGRAALTLPTAALARAVADEWSAQGDMIEPRTMPLTGLANAAIDRVAPAAQDFADGLARFGESDLLVYRADDPSELAARQNERWDPLLAWAGQRYDVGFAVQTGIVHRPQPAATIERLRDAVRARDPFALAGLSPMVTVGGSLVVALAVAEGAIGPADAFAAVELDSDWQAERWGADALAEDARASREADFLAGARFLALLDRPQ